MQVLIKEGSPRKWNGSTQSSGSLESCIKAGKDRWVEWVQSVEVNFNVQECQRLRGTGDSVVVAFGDNAVNLWFCSREIAQIAKGRQNIRQMSILFTGRGGRLNILLPKDGKLSAMPLSVCLLLYFLVDVKSCYLHYLRESSRLSLF